MGDLCRFRQFLQKKNYLVNRNYKSMDHDKLFLSTVNSSKGLERPHVFIALTFPLELAFANFSNDLVVNLVSVGLSRCKENVVFCVPTYSDRFSDVLHLYPECPKPEKNAVSNKKHVREQQDGIQDILHRSHSTTEILRQGMLTYQTRDVLRSCAKYVGNNPFPPGERVRWSMRNEEEASFMGILYEVLITSLWAQRWPELDVGGMTEIRNNPMYTHCRQNIDKGFQKLVGTFRKPYSCNFDVLYEYTEYHILLSQKIRVRVSKERKEEMRSVWNRLRRDVASLTPHFPVKRAQVHLKGSFMTGVADFICKMNDDQDIVLYEIKTCSQSDWKEEAFTQAALYMSMTKQKKGTIRLLNPFRRELYEYQICLQSKEKKVLTQIGRELLLWNFNCFLAKYENNVLMPPLPNKIQQYLIGQEETFLEFLASTKARITSFTDNKIIIPPHQKNLFFDGNRQDLLEWLLEEIQYKKKDEHDELPEISKDSFYLNVLVGVYIRKSYCFR